MTACLRALQEYLAHKKQPPPQDQHRALGMTYRGMLLLVSEVPLYLQSGRARRKRRDGLLSLARLRLTWSVHVCSKGLDVHSLPSWSNSDGKI